MEDEITNQPIESRAEAELLMASAPEGVIERVCNDAHDQIKDITGKLGTLCAIAGHSCHRAAIATVDAETTDDTAIVACMTLVIHEQAIVQSGNDPEEARQAISQALQALDDYFNTFKPQQNDFPFLG